MPPLFTSDGKIITGPILKRFPSLSDLIRGMLAGDAKKFQGPPEISMYRIVGQRYIQNGKQPSSPAGRRDIDPSEYEKDLLAQQGELLGDYDFFGCSLPLDAPEVLVLDILITHKDTWFTYFELQEKTGLNPATFGMKLAGLRNKIKKYCPPEIALFFQHESPGRYRVLRSC